MGGGRELSHARHTQQLIDILEGLLADAIEMILGGRERCIAQCSGHIGATVVTASTYLGSNCGRRHLVGLKRLSRFTRLDAQFAGGGRKVRELALRNKGRGSRGVVDSQARC